MEYSTTQSFTYKNFSYWVCPEVLRMIEGDVLASWWAWKFLALWINLIYQIEYHLAAKDKL